MAHDRTIQLYRGTTAQNDAFTGAAGEVTVDTQTHELRVHDGSTVGGHIIYTKTKVDTALSGKANTDMDNLTSTGQNIANWSTNVTNCITEIPQDIKLELNSGTLTLKAGSKCYLKTDTTSPSISVATDLTTTQTTDGTYFAIYNGSALTTVLTSTYDYSSLPNTYSLPLGIVNVSNGAIASLDNIFNGFGFIGSTIFALPGVKGLIPSGRNSDGSLNNTEYTLTSVATLDMSPVASGSRTIILKNDGTLERCSVVNITPENYLLRDGSPRQAFSILDCQVESSKIIVFERKRAFQAFDASDINIMANMAMPSNIYLPLTLGASGTTYTAPADGYFYVSKLTNGTDQYLQLINQSAGKMQYFAWGPTNGAQIHLVIPAGKGATIQVAYTAGGTTQAFNFVYANGSVKRS